MSEYIYLNAADCLKLDKKIIFASTDFNLLFELNMATNDINLVTSIPEHVFFDEKMFSGMTIWRNKIILSPNRNRQIWIYDYDENVWNSIALKKFNIGENQCLLNRPIVCGNRVIMGGAEAPCIIVLDMNSNEIKYIEYPLKKLTAMAPKGDIYFRQDYVVLNDKLYMATAKTNEVLIYDLNTDNYEWKKLGTVGFSGIAWDGDNFWLSPRHAGNIIKWDGKNTWKEIKIDDGIKHDYSFCGVVCTNAKAVFPALLNSKSVYVDKNGSVQYEDEKYVFYKSQNDDIYSLSKSKVFKVESFDNTREYKLYITPEKLDVYLTAHNYKSYDYFNELREENESFDLEWMLKTLV